MNHAPPSGPRGAMTLLSVVLVVMIVLMLASFVWASLEMSLARGLASVWSTRWGVVTLGDLGVGLVFVSVWIALLERSAARAAPWIIGMFMLGNFTTLVYLLYRCRRARSLRDLVLVPSADLRSGPERQAPGAAEH